SRRNYNDSSSGGSGSNEEDSNNKGGMRPPPPQPQQRLRPTSAITVVQAPSASSAAASSSRGQQQQPPPRSPSSASSYSEGEERQPEPILVRSDDNSESPRSSRSSSASSGSAASSEQQQQSSSRRQKHRRDSKRRHERSRRRQEQRGGGEAQRRSDIGSRDRQGHRSRDRRRDHRDRDRDSRTSRDSRKRRHGRSPARSPSPSAKQSRPSASSAERQEEAMRRRLELKIREKERLEKQQRKQQQQQQKQKFDEQANEDDDVDVGNSPMVSIEEPPRSAGNANHPTAIASSPSNSSVASSKSSAGAGSSSPRESPTKQKQPEQQQEQKEAEPPKPPRRVYLPAIQGCRNVEEYHCLNRIEEGTYGVVYRACDKKTKEIVALKRLKMENEREGFPITSLREINTLLKAQHENIVTVREIVVGSNMDKIYIVMDYVAHDLKSLMEIMTKPFKIEEVKCLMLQLLRAVAHLHDNWILHRDLKTSNLLLSHQGILKVGDFGLAREYGSPLKKYTTVVVTLWYRSVELLLGTKLYSTPIDCWSVGCIFGELLLKEPLFRGKGEIEQLKLIFRELGRPTEKIWPDLLQLAAAKRLLVEQPLFDGDEYRFNRLKNRFPADRMSDAAFGLINGLLTFDPSRRLTAEQALKHEYFSERPAAIDPSLFPTWPARSEGHRAGASHGHQQSQQQQNRHSPKPPSGGKAYSRLIRGGDGDIFNSGVAADTANPPAAPSAAVAAAAAAAAAVSAKLPPPPAQSQPQPQLPPGFNLRGGF
ncbi:hypothetical protein BOX15_Mlig023243g1, partial [Macrostomum lignano]